MLFQKLRRMLRLCFPLRDFSEYLFRNVSKPCKELWILFEKNFEILSKFGENLWWRRFLEDFKRFFRMPSEDSYWRPIYNCQLKKWKKKNLSKLGEKFNPSMKIQKNCQGSCDYQYRCHCVGYLGTFQDIRFYGPPEHAQIFSAC